MKLRLLKNGQMTQRDAAEVGALANRVHDILLRRTHAVLEAEDDGVTPEIEQAWMMDDKLKELRNAVSRVNWIADSLNDDLQAQLKSQ
tara:strand:- start:128 stop:391 length:264 start_codon:yes stop_codon:yes gene_type:complete